jgi:uncharacterized protein YpmB
VDVGVHSNKMNRNFLKIIVGISGIFLGILGIYFYFTKRLSHEFIDEQGNIVSLGRSPELLDYGILLLLLAISGAGALVVIMSIGKVFKK